MGWDFSPRGFARVIAITVAAMLINWMAAIGAVSFLAQFAADFPRLLTWITALTLPPLISGPVSYLFASKLRELAIAHHTLSIIASKDSLTTVLNRGAFVMLVDAYLQQMNLTPEDSGGMLMIDADHFKTVNDRYGHSAGDEALRLIANIIKGVVRGTDLVGRIGGEEFAVFLPRSNLQLVSEIAERIRRSINGAVFSPNGKPEVLSVSVGGIVYRGAMSFDQLLAAADRQLYEAKATGRDKTIIDPLVLVAA